MVISQLGLVALDTGPVSRYGVTFFRRYDGGGEAALSEGLGEGMRSLHAGIVGNADLSKETHGWTAEGTARMTLHAAMADGSPEPAPPATGDYAPGGFVLLAMGLGGAITALVGVLLVIVSRRQRNEVIR